MEQAPRDILERMLQESEPPYDSLSTEFRSVEEVETHYKLLRCQTPALDSARYWYPNANETKIELLFERKRYLSDRLAKEKTYDYLLEHLKDLRRANVNFPELRAEDCCVDECGTVTWRFLPPRNECWYSDEEVKRTRDRLLKDVRKLQGTSPEKHNSLISLY
ncbi:MAG: hypothetical protein M1813_001792 [Trichoglossum hirsutum]|nr:MAG: hypothetical protein M1813_001792 [Trichoglossum hirsutum]